MCGREAREIVLSMTNERNERKERYEEWPSALQGGKGCGWTRRKGRELFARSEALGALGGQIKIRLRHWSLKLFSFKCGDIFSFFRTSQQRKKITNACQGRIWSVNGGGAAQRFVFHHLRRIELAVIFSVGSTHSIYYSSRHQAHWFFFESRNSSSDQKRHVTAVGQWMNLAKK